MTERNLVDVVALLASIESRDETNALVYRIEARHETRCKEATSTSLHSKKKEACKIEPPQINNECIEKALIQLKEQLGKLDIFKNVFLWFLFSLVLPF